jgi:predicted nuclease with TOPRIM domain
MFLVEWDFIYNPRNDSWEIISNNGGSSKSGAEDFIKELQDREKLLKENESLKSQLEHSKNELIGFKHGHSQLLKIVDEKESQNEKLQKAIDDIRKLKLHDIPVPQDSTSFQSFMRKQTKLKSILSKVDKI